MTYTVHRIALSSITAITLLSGCASSSSQQDVQAIYRIPTPQASPYLPPVSENYAAQNPSRSAFEPAYATVIPIEQSPDYQRTDLYEVGTEASRIPGQAVVQTRPKSEIVTRVGNRPARYENGFAPFEASQASRTADTSNANTKIRDDSGMTARERAAEMVAERRAKRANASASRANPKIDRRSFLGRFVTRPSDETRPEPASRAVQEQTPTRSAARIVAPQPVATPRPQSFAERSVARAPIPGLKPYILARTPSPSSKPRRAAPTPQSREFAIVSAATLPNALPAATPPSSVTIPTEPGADLSARFFPTPGKPSTRGTDQDRSLDVAAIDAARYGIGENVGTVVDANATTAKWADAVSLIENGEVEALAILEDADLVLTLCSGRDILTTPPDLAAAATLTAPQIICGQNKPLALR